jgi:2-polyprenyl-3-methyl-5-hydroxy-6-metoxy-1,4-benzoquinol methylase
MNNWINSYNADVLEYTQMAWNKIFERGAKYESKHYRKFGEYEDKSEYYRDTGIDQLCRQVWFHNAPIMIADGEAILNLFAPRIMGKGLDYGCGSAPIGYELLKRGAKIDFVDIDDCSGYEFLKWRIKKNGNEKAGWALTSGYDFAIFLDALEHISNCDAIIKDVLNRMNQKSMIVTNYFINNDRDNPEHISMDHSMIREILKQNDFNSYLFGFGEFLYQDCLWGRNATS